MRIWHAWLIGTLLCLFVGITMVLGHVLEANDVLRRAVRLEAQGREALEAVNRELRAELAVKPIERIVYEPCKADVGHVTPIFGRDSQVFVR